VKLPIHRHGTKGNFTYYPLDHRPWPPPAKPEVLKQIWHDLFFAHWPVSVDYLHTLFPDGLQIDTYDVQAWIRVVPFRMAGIRLPRCELFCTLYDDRMSLYDRLLLFAENSFPDSL
jgi:hypothetical protein